MHMHTHVETHVCPREHTQARAHTQPHTCSHMCSHTNTPEPSSKGHTGRPAAGLLSGRHPLFPWGAGSTPRPAPRASGCSSAPFRTGGHLRDLSLSHPALGREAARETGSAVGGWVVEAVPGEKCRDVQVPTGDEC